MVYGKYISLLTMVYKPITVVYCTYDYSIRTYDYSIHGVYKPANITGGATLQGTII